ncbi:hypothetical protein HTZ84_22315 [Haloterrigena sp. SYSU A558-1]|uniref:Uncharacterized protein n=1 Tax=Haloterrigena gelatinilytica TaxID=2741724 RepID=A0ABX2LMW6_9EURY|nr:hypothetical protein [Haloterrigena gelatinilytica]NUC75002.1 hypothetical protein [Haloterrigena gelatinilytica]
MSSDDTEHDPEESINGLNPKFAVENRIDMSLQAVADIHTKWAYVRMGEGGVDGLRQKAEHLEEYAAELQAAIDRYEDTESDR